MNQKNITIFVLLILVGYLAYYFGSKHSSGNNENLFVWEPPQDILMSPSTNITDSATCRFKKSFNTFFEKKITNSELNPPERIYYIIGDDNEADTVTFVDLNTEHPKVKTNSGESELTVLNDNPDTITLIDLGGINDPAHGFSTYKLFKKKGILIYSGAIDYFTIIGPITGTLEMGYCN